ncbi:hypothetical protein [Desulfonema magnum]|uniref:Uncharacterized protein n=1 Tax=Desulfonema magnum TaxID=45655 RepID=A0A975BM46_9BACT|nr:hypothetical protein [Desulfonema magnum]QTA88036.1 Uncharacterized protein dnm_040760 [Desulfonema magnum]
MKEVYELDVYKLAEKLSDALWHTFEGWPEKAKNTLILPDGVCKILPDGVYKILPDGVYKILPDGVYKILPDGVYKILPDGVYKILPDGVCNPVRNIFRIAARKRFGRGCKPRPAAKRFGRGCKPRPAA